MCLAVPAQLVSVINNERAKASIGGVMREINIALIDDPQPGEFVILHVGYALSKVNEEEARRTLEVMAETGVLADVQREAAQ